MSYNYRLYVESNNVFLSLYCVATYLQIACDLRMQSQRKLPGHHHPAAPLGHILPRRDHPAAPLCPVYVGHNLPEAISLCVLLRHFQEHNFWPDREQSTIIDTPGKRHGKLFFSDSDAADCAIAVVNGTKIGSFTIIVEHWESRVKQPLSRARSVPIKLSNCHHTISKVELGSMVCDIDPTASVVFHQTELTKPNWAHINCVDCSSADKVVNRLHGTIIHGLPLSVKVVGNNQHGSTSSINQPIPSTPALQPAPVRPTSGTPLFVSVKVSYLPKSATEDDIRRRLWRISSDVSVKVRDVADQKFNYAYINCSDKIVADEVVHCLNGRSVDDNKLRAKIVEQPPPKSVLPVEPPKVQKSFDVPREWEGDLETFSLKEVPSDSADFSKVLLLMQKTMPTVRISKLERIQNKWLWNRYSQHCDEIKEKNGGVLMEKELFHGTGVNDPQLIYKGEEGFDMRFCNTGMWGRGIYFTASAKYSDRYAFTSRGGGIAGSRQMFLARVNIGETHECRPDRNLTMPPMKPSQASTSSSVQFSLVRYDSVTGITSGSQVYIVYDNRKAYPLYLITYTLALPSFLF